MKNLLLVDGYNVIGADPTYRALKEKDLESARVRVVEDVAGYSHLVDADAVVVFDASGRSGSVERSSDVLGVTVVFTRQGSTADSAIERLAHRARRQRRVTVATSDYAQQKTVFSEGVIRMSAAELIARMREEATEADEHASTGRRRVFLEDRVDGQVRASLRKLSRG